jgi:hypothetical protein
MVSRDLGDCSTRLVLPPSRTLPRRRLLDPVEVPTGSMTWGTWEQALRRNGASLASAGERPYSAEMVGRVVREFETMRVDTLDWPIVVTEFPERRVQDATLHAVLGYLEALMVEAEKGREKVFFVTDLTKMREVTPASQRKYTGEWIQRTANLARVTSVGGAQVTPSTVLRGIITAVFWLHPSPTISFTVATRREAILRGIELLEKAGVLLPPRLIGLRDASGGGR